MARKICIITSLRCNLNCVYCYENKTACVINTPKVKNILKSKWTKDCIIEFYGGEPFLEFSAIQDICFYIWNSIDSKQKFVITTNGTLVHGNIKQWIYDHSNLITLCLSIDGDKYSHNINRSNSFDSINVNFFVKTWSKSIAKMTVSPLTIGYLASNVEYLHSRGFSKILVNMAQMQDWKETLYTEFSRQLMSLISFYEDNLYIEPCSLFDINFENIDKRESFHKGCGIGDEVIIDGNGNLYPCRMLIPGIISKEKISQIKSYDFNNSKNLISVLCNDCTFLTICKTCYAANFLERHSFNSRDPRHCILNKIRIKAAAKLFTDKVLNYSSNSNCITPRIYNSVKAILNHLEEINNIAYL